MEMVEDLEGCKVLCENRMKDRLDELAKKKEMLKGVKEQVLECRCQLPVDETVEVKRTPSLVAMCRCAPEDKLLVNNILFIKMSLFRSDCPNYSHLYYKTLNYVI